MSPQRTLVLGTAGHIDHGKTALVRLLTGVEGDRLAEERRRGITIELGFTPWRLTEDLEASVIDVPGHERLVRTMVAGAGGVDLAILVVAADDGVMPQTREHLDVLRLLGVPAGLLVLTKVDLVGDDPELLALVTEELRAATRGTVFDGAPILPTSARTGVGADRVREAVIARSRDLPARDVEGPAFLPLDRLFHKAGHGTIGTGTTLRGGFAVGDTVEVLGAEPAPVATLRVRALEARGQPTERADAGQRTALNLVGRGVDRVSRGMAIASPGAYVASPALIAWVEVLAAARPMTEGGVACHVGTSERQARATPLGARSIAPGESGAVLLRFARPVATFAGQRLVLRRPGIHGQATVAGGEVLDPEPALGKGAARRAAARVPSLRGEPKGWLLALAKDARAAGVTPSALRRRLPSARWVRHAHQLERRGRLVRVLGSDERWVHADLVEQRVDDVVALVDAFHDASPLSPGLPEGELDGKLPAPERHLAPTVLARALARGRLLRHGERLAVPGRGSTVSPAARERLDRIRTAMRDAGPTPPFDRELVGLLGLGADELGDLLALLRRQHRLVRVADGLHYDPDALARLEDQLRASLSGGEGKTVTELKAELGLSRKWAVPLLEHTDRAKVTRRVGDVRVLHPSQPASTPG